MNDERKITIIGTKAILHPWSHDLLEIEVDHKDSIEKIGKAVNQLNNNSKPKIIAIVGSSGSGKTILAKTLYSNAKNCQLIDVCSLTKNFTDLNPVIDPMLLKDSMTTCIIDEAGLAQNKSLFDGIQKIIDKQGVVVLMLQDLLDVKTGLFLSSGLFADIKCFNLSKDGLTMVE